MEESGAQQRTLPPRRLRPRSGGKAALLLAAFGLLPVALGPWSLSEAGADSTQALTLPRLKKDKVLFTNRGYELRLQPRKSKNAVGKAIPKVVFRKVPARPVTFSSAGFGTDADLDKEMLGFPFTTSNTGSIGLGFPRLNAELKLKAEDPPISAELDDATKSAELELTHSTSLGGDLSLGVKSTGKWGASWNRKVEDIGTLHSTLNSDLDWSLDLDTTYPKHKGVKPYVTYGATQDGMRVRAKAEGAPVKGAYASYQVQNLPGKYGPVDFVHDGKLAYTSGRQTLTAEGTYDRKLPKRPVKGSLSYVVKSKPMTMTASVDFDRYRLKAESGPAQLSAAVGLKATSGSGPLGGRPAELGAKLGPVSAQAKLAGSKKPRVRLELGDI